MSANDLNARDTLSLYREFPYFGLNVNLARGQFNNCLPSHLPAKKYLEKLSSIYDLNLFKLNALELSKEKGKVLHLPHFHIHHPRKPDQIRVGFPVVLPSRTSRFMFMFKFFSHCSS